MEPEGSLPLLQEPFICLVQARGSCNHFLKRSVFTEKSCQHLAQPRSWRTTSCRLSATAYSIYSQLSTTLEAVSPTVTCGRPMLCWQGPTYHGLLFFSKFIFCGSQTKGSIQTWTV